MSSGGSARIWPLSLRLWRWRAAKPPPDIHKASLQGARRIIAPSPGKLRSQSQGCDPECDPGLKTVGSSLPRCAGQRRLLRTRIGLLLHDTREHLQAPTLCHKQLVWVLPAKADAANASALIAINPLPGDSDNARKVLFPARGPTCLWRRPGRHRLDYPAPEAERFLLGRRASEERSAPPTQLCQKALVASPITAQQLLPAFHVASIFYTAEKCLDSRVAHSR